MFHWGDWVCLSRKRTPVETSLQRVLGVMRRSTGRLAQFTFGHRVSYRKNRTSHENLHLWLPCRCRVIGASSKLFCSSRKKTRSTARKSVCIGLEEIDPKYARVCLIHLQTVPGPPVGTRPEKNRILSVGMPGT